MTQMIGAKLQLEPVFGFGQRRHHDTRIVDQQI